MSTKAPVDDDNLPTVRQQPTSQRPNQVRFAPAPGKSSTQVMASPEEKARCRGLFPSQDLTSTDFSKLHALDEVVISRQATVNIGTIGHVAHGKSTLVKAISGVHTVRFKNELERNITIKLGYANAKIFKCDNPVCPRPGCYRSYGSWQEPRPLCERPGCGSRMTLLRHVSFVDCPGHDILMATMLNGAAVMDAALLLIAGNDPCPQPQTSEHLAAVEIMKLKHLIILTLQAEENPLQFAVPGGLIGVGTRIDPFLTRADRLVGQVLGAVGQLPDIFTEVEITFYLLRQLLGVKQEGENRSQHRVARLTRGEILMVNIGSTSAGGRVLVVKQDEQSAKIALTCPVCTQVGEKIALSRRVDKHWRLIGWGEILRGVVIGV
eukprot:gnl/Spiro4/1139_TR600_c0_g1_i2.p1 gnl/Spiro4/1139_TR600_c0_g1~~gnl/Spiro4/1139_TR600_c0_g1_i2.p1  ORF type:complete len:391 (+),score=63.00 gnl/Spiro4/1139_TR600_c0_g1_i2:38-1174(+)